MRTRVVLAALTVLLAGCGQPVYAPSQPPVSFSPAIVAGSSEVTPTLLARPLKLPTVQPGATCPVTPVAKVASDITDPRGHGPFYLGGPMPRGAYPWNKTVYVVEGPSVPGPILFRGGRVDGSGRLQFTGRPATTSEQGVLLASGGGVSDYFYDQALHPPGGDAFYVYPSSQGCYAIQVDAPTFEDVIVLAAS